MRAHWLRRVVVSVGALFVLVLFAGCGVVVRGFGISERAEGPCPGDAVQFDSEEDTRTGDTVRGQALEGWSWEHFGWKCVRTYFPSGRTETVYIR